MQEIISNLDVIIGVLIGIGITLGMLIPALKKLKDTLSNAFKDGKLTTDEILQIIEDSIGILKIWKLFKR